MYTRIMNSTSLIININDSKRKLLAIRKRLEFIDRRLYDLAKKITPKLRRQHDRFRGMIEMTEMKRDRARAKGCRRDVNRFPLDINTLYVDRLNERLRELYAWRKAFSKFGKDCLEEATRLYVESKQLEHERERMRAPELTQQLCSARDQAGSD